MNLALVTGVSLGYLAWGRDVARLERELERAQWRAATIGVPRVLTAQGVVRAVLPDTNTIILTHGEIEGFMAPMTMMFRLSEPKLRDGLEVGDVVRFTLRGIPPDLEITEIVRLGKT
jgi:Cu(I)/Ag(I) efflux system membrane protein CusA/SilA